MLRTVPPLGCISVGFLLNLLNDALLEFGLLVSPWPFFKNYFWLPWLCCYVQAFPSCTSGGCSSVRCAGFSLPWLLLLQSMGCRVHRLSSCGTGA